MKKIIHAKFNEENKEAVARFEKQLQDETKYLGVLIQNQFEEEFTELKQKFNADLKDRNFQSFNQLTLQFIKHLHEE
jgi:hypothetical protein